jgi:Na+-driven multidrug efflux pump
MRNVWYQCRIGSSSLLGELMLAILFVVGNMVFMRQLGDDGVGAFGVACYYTPFVFMIGNSIVQSVQPILSSGYATGNYERVRLVRNVMVRTSVGFGVVFTLLFALCPELLVSLFIDPSCRAGVIAVKGLPLFATGFLFVIANLCIVGYYQSLERVGPGVLVMLLRGVVLLLPCFMLLPSWLGDAGIWLATPLAEGATVAVFAVFMLGRKLKNISWNTIKRTKVS